MSTTELTEQNFTTTVDKPGIVFVDFWATWCAPCRMFAPVFEKSAKAHPDVVFGKVNTEEQQELAEAFGIQSIPTLMVFKDGQVVNQFIGGHGEGELLGAINQALN